jgi:hypothetical protein
MAEFFKHDNYEHYVECQTKTYERKPQKRWVEEAELIAIAEIIQSRLESHNIQFGICHGVRTGFESRLLTDLLNIEVVGTDIASQSSDIISIDFHEILLDWWKKADFIYSNALDHSYDPEMALRQWIRCLNNHGILLIHVGKLKFRKDGTIKMTSSDCFQADLKEYLAMLRQFGMVEKAGTNRRGRVVFIVRPNR